MEIEMNKFDQLVHDLKTGKITHIQLQIAFRASIRERDDIPDPIKDILCGRSESHSGVIYKAFAVIYEIIGCTTLAYKRGHQAGQEFKDDLNNP